jgi:hypothetical protein
LVNVPTAEVVETGQYAIELQRDGSFARGNADTHILNTELGFIPRFEAGLDFDLSHEAETGTLLNGKYLLSLGGKKSPALAIGVCNVGHDISATPYLAATRSSERCGDISGRPGSTTTTAGSSVWTTW